MKYTIYTDGACSGNPGPGGWGAVIFDERKKQHDISGKVKETTNNRMELMAPIMALKKIKSKSEVVIFTDSTYVKNGITEWIKKWEKNDWKSSSNKKVKNKDLWLKLNDLCQKNKVTWKWVKGHSNNKYNDLADELATLAIKN
jgi:ribonuclease HI